MTQRAIAARGFAEARRAQEFAEREKQQQQAAKEERERAEIKEAKHQRRLLARRDRRAQGIVITPEQAAPTTVQVDPDSVKLRGYHALRRVFPHATHLELVQALQHVDQLPIDARVVAASRQLMVKHSVAASAGQTASPTPVVVRVVPSSVAGTGAAPQMKLLRRATTVGSTSFTTTLSAAPKAPDVQEVVKTISEERLPTILMKLLTSQGLSDKSVLATTWVEEQGAADLEEVLDNFNSFAAALGLTEAPVSKEEEKEQPEQGPEETETTILSPVDQLRKDLSEEVAATKARALAAKAEQIEANKQRLGQATASEGATGEGQQQGQQPQFQPPMRLVRMVKTISTPVQPLGHRLLSEGVPGQAPTKVVVVKKQQQKPAQASKEETERESTSKLERASSLELASMPAGTDKQVYIVRGRLAARDREFNQKGIRQWTPPRTRWRTNKHLLTARIPTQAEVDAVQIAKQRALEAEAAAFGELPEKKDQLTTMDGVRQAFLEEHGTELFKDLGHHVTLRPAPTSQAVEQKFVRAVKVSGSVPAAGYHGTAKQNFNSIFDKGLLVPGKDNNGVEVANGSAHGVGIYTAKPGAARLSRSFCDSQDLLVCGIVTKQVDPEKVEQGKKPKMVNGHREHRKPDPLAAAQAPTIMGRFKVRRNDRFIREVGDARIIFREDHVAPLFIAEGAGNVKHPGPNPNAKTIEVNWNKSGLETRGGKRQEVVMESGERIWVVPAGKDAEVRDWNAMRVRRMWKDKDLMKSRTKQRAEKASEQDNSD
eukprot:CAMPEP_0206490836 /NCGR_PEP_ID=MMETSP0324_2-20121206/44441_1 /ASSEMBLY_ACC=CAM_ASM_000836 /TAXON_ID=2866 /ORGANISM="Crypthecodinium cohnii, Strain Seligo" /LENGTH=770 /DNA_ID=CAMNT_0053971519 /DNA_START=217 /DNA_END=2526 /DNA_ORIENTATION=+